MTADDDIYEKFRSSKLWVASLMGLQPAAVYVHLLNNQTVVENKFCTIYRKYHSDFNFFQKILNNKQKILKKEKIICVHFLDFLRRILILGFMKVARYSDTCMMPRPSQRPAVPPIDVKNVKKLN